MKKFLTVLLVIAVMFTFSFGSAFAAATPMTDADDIALVGAASEYMQNLVASNFDTVYADVVKTKTDAYITEAAWAQYKDEMKDALVKEVKDAATAYLNGTTTPLPDGWKAYPTNMGYVAGKLFPSVTGKDYATLYAAITGGTLKNADNVAYNILAAQAQFVLNFADSMKIYDKVDVENLYSKTTPTADNSYYKRAVAAIDAAKEALTDYYFEANGTLKASMQAAMTSVSIIKEAEAWYKGLRMSGTTLGEITFPGLTELFWDDAHTISKGQYKVTGIPTVDTEASQGAVDAATSAAIKAQVAKNVAVFLKDNTTAADKEFAANYAEVYNYLADAVPNGGNLAGAVKAHGEAAMLPAVKGSHGTAMDTVVTKIAALESLAAKYSAEKDSAGNLVRDAKEVEKLVKKAKVYEYANVVGVTDASIVTYTAETAEADIKAMSSENDAAYLAFQKEAKKADLADELDVIIWNYYDLEGAKVTAAYEAAYAKIDAAAKASDFATIERELDKEVAKIADGDKVEALFTTGAMKKELDDQAASLTALVQYKNTPYSQYTSPEYIVPGTTARLTALRDYYIENGARTAAEMKALTGVVEAVVADLPTNGSLAEAKKAAEDAIKALPAASKIVAADKDAVVAAWELAEDYADMAEIAGLTSNTQVTNIGTLTNAIDALYTAMNNELYKAYATTDKTDKTALRALADEYDAANATGDWEMFTTEFTNPGIEAALDTIKAKELAAVKAAINALPINITEADKAQVEAARKLYDAYVADWTDIDEGANLTDINGDKWDGYVAADVTNFRDLALAEAELGLNYDAEENAKAYVQDMKIAARSVKTSKGVKITIKADVQQLLDDGFTVEYRFYRSTKSNKNFGKPMIVKSTNTYTNTKGVKGTRYYYKAKIVVKNAAGEVVATTPLTQCLYATRVF